jgi:signal transduction histidine kinase
VKKWIKGFKQQTLVLLLSLTLGLSLVFSLFAVLTAFMVEDALLDNLLKKESAHIELFYSTHKRLPSIHSESYSVFTDLNNLPAWIKTSLDNSDIAGEIFTDDSTHYHYRKLQLNGQPAILLAEVSGLLVVSHQPGIFTVFVILMLLVFLLAIVLAIRFSRHIVNPLLQLTEAVAANAESNNKTRLPDLPFELGYLSNSLQTSFDRLNQLLEAEKTFATSVSHELRTPLTVLRNAVQLIEQRGFKADDLLAIKHASEHMQQTISVLLALARSESRIMQSCQLNASLEKAILSCYSMLEDFQLELNVPADLDVQAHPVLIELLFINLLRNAAEHSSEKHLLIKQEQNHLIFENKARNYLDSDLTDAGVKHESSDGIGHGLYLVARIVEHFSWQLSIDATPEKFRVVIKYIQ